MEEYRVFPALLLLLTLSVPSAYSQTEADASEPIVSHHSFFNVTPNMADTQPLGINIGISLTDVMGLRSCLYGPNMGAEMSIRARHTSPHKQIGQNIWAFTGTRGNPLPVSRATQDWYDEVHDYTYVEGAAGICAPGKVCGHYTQVVWADTNKVGCGRQFCSSVSFLTNAWYIVCNYAPAGNHPDRPPYSLGPACTQCASGIGECYNGLCRLCSDHSERCICEQKCQNCGQLNTQRCSCTCMDGWWGADCSRECVNTHRYCGANPGWYDDRFCTMGGVFSSVPGHCPLMCGLCKARDPSATCDPDVPTGGDGGAVSDEVCNTKFTAFVYIGNKLYAFEGAKVWRFRSNGELISDREGEKARRYFKKLPKKPAGAFAFANGNIGFIKGSKIYVYSGKTLVSGYPKTLQSLGLPKNFKAAFHRSEQGRSGKTYFMKGDNIWRFDESRRGLDSGYPRPLVDLFPRIKSGPSGAFINEQGPDLDIEARGQSLVGGEKHSTPVIAVPGEEGGAVNNPAWLDAKCHRKLHIVYGKKYYTIAEDNTVSRSKLLGNKYRIPGC